MAHTYVFQTITVPAATNAVPDPQVTVVGTVDGVPVTASCWLSEYLRHAASVISSETFLASLMLAALPPGAPSAPQNAPPPGTTITI